MKQFATVCARLLADKPDQFHLKCQQVFDAYSTSGHAGSGIEAYVASEVPLYTSDKGRKATSSSTHDAKPFKSNKRKTFESQLVFSKPKMVKYSAAPNHPPNYKGQREVSSSSLINTIKLAGRTIQIIRADAKSYSDPSVSIEEKQVSS